MALQPAIAYQPSSGATQAIVPRSSWRYVLLGAWLLLKFWLSSRHVFWRDEVRAFSLAQSGSSVLDMLHAIHPEGHPALWYLLLRAVHTLAPYREILPITALVIGIAAMGLFALRAPFRPWQLGLGLFSLFGVFDFTVVARNYGLSALLIFILAAFYARVKDNLLFGLLLALLANTNVPALIIAIAFLLYRIVEVANAGADAQQQTFRWSQQIR